MAVHLHLLLLQIIILLVWAIKASKIQCPTSCGNVSDIRYPFGIGDRCYFNEWFEVTCDNTSGFPVPFFSRTNLKLSEGISRRSNGMATGLGAYVNKLEAENLSGTPFSFSHKLNKFLATGCSNYTTKVDRHPIKPTTGCLRICTCDPAKDKSCYDIMCNIPSSHQVFSDINVPENCTGAVVVEQDWLKTNYLANNNPNVLKEIEHFPVVMEFGRYMGNCVEPYKPKTSCNKDSFCLIQLNSGYFCVCSQPKENNDKSRCTGNLFCNITSHKNKGCSECPRGYELDFSHNGDDKPMCYQPEPKSPRNGRKKNITIGLFSGFGTLSLYIGARRLSEFVRRRTANKLKQKFFKKNGGSLLQQRMSSNDGNIQKPKFFTEYELEKATDSYSEDRIVGQGGQGTVYKGMLKGGRIIAVKRLKKVAERDVFIKEVEILSRINHRNVVQFLGCCLDTEFPLLVHEFIPNGTLFQYIHDQDEEFPLTWDLRLRIAIEVADALHSAASVGIYHRDIKSSDILLDEKYQAKVSDFGTSRSIPVDQTNLTTQELGTYGYLDPEYRGSSQFTEKTGVYSFGVVLAELLTGEKPVRSTNLEEEDRSLALYFLQIMEENRLLEILDARISKDGREQEIETFADLTRRCLELNWRKRPRMREVAAKLADIRPSYVASILKQKCEETEVAGDINNQPGTSSSFTESFFD